MDNNDDNDDFTFCQVTALVNVDLFEAQKIIPGVSNISLNDETSKSSGVLSKRDLRTSKELSDFANAASEDMKSYVSVLQEPKSVVRKPIARAKVPFEKGYSPMDWLKLTRTHPDLAGLKGQSNKRLISLQEVKLHKTEDSMWTVLKGRVYNITPYMKFHPGGVDFLMKAVGKDCTALFNKYHAWVNAEFLLEKCLVGILDDNQ